MKKILTAIIFTCLCLPVFAQDAVAQAQEPTYYVFSDFLPGLVKKKDGTQAHAQMNYNTFTEEMVFIKDTERLAMINIDAIDTIYLGGKVFVPGKNMFFYKATNTPVALYVRDRNNVLPVGHNIGYGSRSESSSISDLSVLIGASAIYKLSLPDGYKLVDHSSYWVNTGKKIVQVNNLKQVQAIFPAKADAIKNFVQQNNIQFGKLADMIKLVEFCNQPG